MSRHRLGPLSTYDRARVLRLIVMPAVSGIALGAAIATLSEPWVFVALGAVILTAVVLIIRTERDIRRSRRQLQEFIALYGRDRSDGA
jgi:Flp pilus assembly protein TadB